MFFTNFFDDLPFTYDWSGKNKSYYVYNDSTKTLLLPLPGFSKQDLEIEIEGRTLNISSKIKKEDETHFKKSFTKRFIIPEDVDVDQINASVENGILTLSFKKSEEVKKIKIF